MKNLKHNALICMECFQVLASFHRHDFRACGCPNSAFVDGGFDYFRYGAKNLKHVEHVYLLGIEPDVKKTKRKKK